MVEKWLTAKQAAELGGYHLNHVRRLMQQGKVNGRKWGQTWQVDRVSFLAYLHEVGASGKRRGPKRS